MLPLMVRCGEGVARRETGVCADTMLPQASASATKGLDVCYFSVAEAATKVVGVCYKGPRHLLFFGGGGCYKHHRPLLFLAAEAATKIIGLCYFWRPRLLQRSPPSATKGIGRWCLLQKASPSATFGGGRCYKGRRCLLQRTSTSATCGGGPVAAAPISINVCYKGHRHMLLAATNGDFSLQVVPASAVAANAPVVTINKAPLCCKEAGKA